MTLEKKSLIFAIFFGTFLGVLISMLVANYYG
jgi:hypothetical protein